MGKFELFPMYNGTFDHDTQLVLVRDITMSSHPKRSWIRKIDKHSLLSLNYNLSFELFDQNDVNIMSNTFLNILLRYFYNSFPKSSTRPCTNNKAWISSSVKIKCSVGS
jgi:hypothetical protein